MKLRVSLNTLNFAHKLFIVMCALLSVFVATILRAQAPRPSYMPPSQDSSIQAQSSTSQNQGGQRESDGLCPLTLSEAHSLNSTTDVGHLTGADILWLLVHPQFVHIEKPSGEEQKRHKWFKLDWAALAICNGEQDANSTVIETGYHGACKRTADLYEYSVKDHTLYSTTPANPKRFETLIRYCYWATKSDSTQEACGELASALLGIGNFSAGKAVLKFAPGCHTRHGGGLPASGCFRTARLAESLRQRPNAVDFIIGAGRSDQLAAGLSSLSTVDLAFIAEPACNQDLDLDACSFSQANGGHIRFSEKDLGDIRDPRNRADKQYMVTLQERQEQRDQQAAERQQQFEDRMNALRSVANQTGSLVLDTGNQQAAAIQAVGDANAAQRQAATQERLAGQRAAQQAASNGSSNGQSVAATQAGGAALPTTHPSAPLTVRFGSITGYQGNAHVVSNPPGIDCPGTCSFQFGQNVAMILSATADQSSAVKSLSCQMSAGTGVLKAGNAMSCSIPQWAYAGPQVIVYVDSYAAPGTASSASNGHGANGSGSGGNGSSTGNGNAAGNGGGNSTGSADQYAAPLSNDCVRSFWDPKFYNWLSYENTCSQTIHIDYMFKDQNYGRASGTTLAPGQHSNTGWSSDEINSHGPLLYFVCPANYLAVDSSTDKFVNQNTTGYRCKKQ